MYDLALTQFEKLLNYKRCGAESLPQVSTTAKTTSDTAFWACSFEQQTNHNSNCNSARLNKFFSFSKVHERILSLVFGQCYFANWQRSQVLRNHSLAFHKNLTEPICPLFTSLMTCDFSTPDKWTEFEAAYFGLHTNLNNNQIWFRQTHLRRSRGLIPFYSTLI